MLTQSSPSCIRLCDFSHDFTFNFPVKKLGHMLCDDRHWKKQRSLSWQLVLLIWKWQGILETLPKLLVYRLWQHGDSYSPGLCLCHLSFARRHWLVSHWNDSFHVMESPSWFYALKDFSRLVGNTSQLLRHSKFVLVSRHQKDSSVTVPYIFFGISGKEKCLVLITLLEILLKTWNSFCGVFLVFLVDWLVGFFCLFGFWCVCVIFCFNKKCSASASKE